MGWIGSNLRLTRKITHADSFSRNGNGNTIWIGPLKHSGSAGATPPPAPPTPIPSPLTLPKPITPYGRKPRRLKLRKTKLGIKSPCPYTTDIPLRLLSNSRSTMLSQAPMPNASDLRTPLNHSYARVEMCSNPLHISSPPVPFTTRTG